MGQTTQLQLPYPELPDVADGPDGFKDLAERLELTQPNLRSNFHYQESGKYQGVTPGVSLTVFESTYASTSIGWVEIDFTLEIITQTLNNVNADGQIVIYINDQIAGSGYHHTYGKTNVLQTVTHGKMAIPRAVSTLAIKIIYTNGINSDNVALQTGALNFDLAQFGASRS